MIELDQWPKSRNYLSQEENDFLRAHISTITVNPTMRLVSTKVSPIVSIFKSFKDC